MDIKQRTITLLNRRQYAQGTGELHQICWEITRLNEGLLLDWVARQVRARHASRFREDFQSVGRIALFEAARGYQFDRDIEFPSYAITCITRAIRVFWAQNHKPIHLKVNVITNPKRRKQFEQRLTAIDQGSCFELDPSSRVTWPDLDLHLEYEDLCVLAQRLPDRERDVFCAFYGIGRTARGLKDTARLWGVHYNTARWVFGKASRKMKELASQ